MLLTISTTYRPATDPGYLLHKNPARFQTFTLPFGQAHVFYPERTEERCTAALLVDVDPVQLVRGKGGAGTDSFSLQPYLNDRPYAASSFLSVALNDVFRTAFTGRSNDRPELAASAIPLQAHIAALPVRRGEAMVHRLIAPLGYEVRAAHGELDERFPDWGESPYFTVDISGTVRLRDLLSHLYVLIPVLDDEKHYWVGQEEIEKLLRHGREWLASHPERNLIATRYLARQRPLLREALARLSEDQVEETEEEHAREEAIVEERISLHEQRHGAVLATLRSSEARSGIERITGLDVSYRTLERAAQRLHLDRMPDRQRERLSLLHGSLTYRDRRLEGYDAATVVEVIEQP